MAEELHAESGAWLAEVDLVISAVFGGVALDVARQSLPSMHKGAIYADFTTASPAALFDAGQLASEAAIQFVDVEIDGAIRDRKSVVQGKSVFVCVDIGGRRFII